MSASLRLRVRELLADLGSNPDEVAATLRRLSITGYLRAPASCPVASYLNNHIYHELLFVTPQNVYHQENIRIIAATPHAVSDFMERFDAGGYPDLVTK